MDVAVYMLVQIIQTILLYLGNANCGMASMSFCLHFRVCLEMFHVYGIFPSLWPIIPQDRREPSGSRKADWKRYTLLMQKVQLMSFLLWQQKVIYVSYGKRGLEVSY